MIRTRFPPSPTGFVHIGSLRTALYDYLFAKKQKGKFILRIEDTDQTRLVPGAVENLLSTLKWARIDHDEGPDIGGPVGPYTQSERTELYKQHVQILIDKGAAYPCFCTKERLDEMRSAQTAAKQAPMYDRTCLKLTPEQISANTTAGIPFVIRQKIPTEKTAVWNDLVRGETRFEGKNIDDQVLQKSDGFPTYHLANVVDDHLMEITHVIRGEEWLSSTPKHLWLYEAFGWEKPLFAHIPLLLNQDKTKLSKRQGDVAVEEYIKKGILPEAMINFIALLGWHPGKGEQKEIFSMTELIDLFSLEQVHKAGAIVDFEKLNWFNWQWQKRKFEEKIAAGANRGEELMEIARPHIPAEWEKDPDYLKRALISIEEKVLQDAAKIQEQIDFYFTDIPLDPALIMNEKMKVTPDIAKIALTEGVKALETLTDWTDENIRAALNEVIQSSGLKVGQILWPIRVALTHKQFSPGAFEVALALGKEKTLERLKDSLAKN